MGDMRSRRDRQTLANEFVRSDAHSIRPYEDLKTCPARTSQNAIILPKEC